MKTILLLIIGLLCGCAVQTPKINLAGRTPEQERTYRRVLAFLHTPEGRNFYIRTVKQSKEYLLIDAKIAQDITDGVGE